MRYIVFMNPSIKTILEKIASWPEEDQEELAAVAAEIEARRTGVHRLTDDERAAVRAGMDAARRGDFATDREIEEFYQLHRKA
jgi:predicted transcriptional regulator